MLTAPLAARSSLGQCLYSALSVLAEMLDRSVVYNGMFLLDCSVLHLRKHCLNLTDWPIYKRFKGSERDMNGQ